jgi:hypothetical protein
MLLFALLISTLFNTAHHRFVQRRNRLAYNFGCSAKTIVSIFYQTILSCKYFNNSNVIIVIALLQWLLQQFLRNKAFNVSPYISLLAQRFNFIGVMVSE